MSCLRTVLAMLFLPGLLAVPVVAHAAVLYKCNAKDGSIAYVSSHKGFTDCKLISTFADPPKSAREPARVANAQTAKTPATPVKRGWVYEENVKQKADFSLVATAITGTALRPDFANVVSVAASSAPVIVPIPGVPTPADVAATTQPVVAAATPALPRVLRGAVYKIERKGGITEYTNVKPRGNAFAVLFTYIATCVACDIHSKINFARTALNLDAYKNEIAAAAADYGVDRALLRAVIHAESAFNPLAISSKGAQGLMQLMPGTAGDLGVTNAFDAAQNIRGGARYLGELLKSFNGDTQLATAAYNAGPGAVQKYHGVPPYEETQFYVQRVATLRDRYQKAM